MATIPTPDLEALNKAAADLSGLMATLAAENKEIKSATLEKIEAAQTQLDALEKKLNDRVAAAAETEEPILNVFKENQSLQHLMRLKSGNARIDLSAPQVHRLLTQYEKKTTIATTNGAGAIGFATTGVLQIDRLDGITAEARQTLSVRSLFTSRPTNLPKIDFVKVTTPMGPASPQHETFAKQETQLVLDAQSELVQTIAIWVPASRQLLSDLQELMAFIQDSLPFYVNLLEDQQFLNGDATGQNLHGIVPQAAAFTSSLLSSSYTKIDVIGHAIQQIAMANEVTPTFVCMNPRDYWDLRMTKDTQGRYLLGDPNSPYDGKIWNLTPVATNSMTAGRFIVGSGSPAVAAIRDRMDMSIDISTEHLDYFTRNLIAIRCEKRTAMIVRRPNAFVTGSLATSP